jgi:hypothetical protein
MAVSLIMFYLASLFIYFEHSLVGACWVFLCHFGLPNKFHHPKDQLFPFDVETFI